jgi:hypothetical protein
MLRLRLVKGFGSTLLALADANRPPTFAFRSTDGGVTWTYLATVNSGSVSPVFITASRWLVVGNDSSGQETTDAGKTWHGFVTDYSDAAGVASTFSFADQDVGYGTVRGAINRTVDGGTHWVATKLPSLVTPFPTTHSPLPPKTANWPSYASSSYGYSLRYPPHWFDGGSGPPSEHYFTNKKGLASPLAMEPEDVMVGVHADCLYGTGATEVISQANVVVDTISVVRQVVRTSGPDGTLFFADAIVWPGTLCYRITMLAWNQKTIEANLADFETMLETVRFYSRTAPVQTTL